MNIHHHTTPHNLEKYSFLWSEARLIIAAVALLIGGTPVLSAVLPFSALAPLVTLILTVCWIISGLAAGYMIYRWVNNGKRLFGEKKQLDMIAFWFSVITGINLGLAGLVRTNIAMNILGSTLFVIGGILYILCAVYLWRRWIAHGRKMF